MTNVMTMVLAVGVGFLASRALWLVMRRGWAKGTVLRENYQGVRVPTATGIILAVTLVGVEGLRMVMGSIGIGSDPGLTSFRAAALIVVLGFCLVGLLDDLVGTAQRRGFKGHLRSLSEGELTTGGIKLIGGIGIAIIGAAVVGSQSFGELFLNSVIIAAAANLVNLLDVRPGRAGKMGVFLGVVVIIASSAHPALVPLGVVVGATIGLLFEDLRERLMLGDTGANALGAIVGLGLVLSVSGSGRIVIALVLVGLNVLSEFVSFSKLIDSVAPFRWLDQMGRRRPPVVDVRESLRRTSVVAPPFRRPEPRRKPLREEGEDLLDLDDPFEEPTKSLREPYGMGDSDSLRGSPRE